MAFSHGTITVSGLAVIAAAVLLIRTGGRRFLRSYVAGEDAHAQDSDPIEQDSRRSLFGGLDAPLLDDLGDGGTERWITYPVVLWQVMFGGALMAGSTAPGSARSQPRG